MLINDTWFHLYTVFKEWGYYRELAVTRWLILNSSGSHVNIN